MRRVLPILLGVMLAAGACSAGNTSSSGAGGSAPPDVVNFTLNWFPLADHAAYYVAYDKGWYTDAGLAVNILQGAGSADTLRRVTIGQADIGLGDSGVQINGMRNGATVKLVMMVMDRNWDAIWTTKSSGITTVADLCGHTIGAPVGDANRQMWPALANAVGIDANCVSWVDIQPAAKYQALASGQVDAIVDAVTGAPFVYQALGGQENAVEITYADNGVDVPAIAMVTSDQMIKNRPDVIKRFIAASLKGWEYVFQNPDDALTIEQKYWPSLDIPTYKVNLQLVESLMQTDNFKQNGVGHFDPNTMKSAVETLNKFFTAKTDISDPTTTYTNEFLPAEKVAAPTS